MNCELIYRQCARCTHIEDCPHPGYDENDNWILPKNCPKPEQIKLTPRVRDEMTHEYFEKK
jgi:hypothetical protein